MVQPVGADFGSAGRIGADRHPGVGQGRRLLPGLSRTASPAAAAWTIRARSSPGTLRPPITASRAATCTASPTASTTSPTSGSRRSTSTPIFSSASNHRYHTYDYLEVDPLLGGDEALRELLDRAHAKGIRVVLDGVFNHTGRGFWPFHHVLECGLGSPYLDWFLVDRDALAAGRPLRAVSGRDPAPCIGAGRRRRTGSARSRSSGLGYRAWWELPALPKLNTDNPLGPRVPDAGRRALDPLRRWTAGAWTCRRRSTTTSSGASSDAG